MSNDITFCGNSEKCPKAKNCKRSRENHALHMNENWSDYSSWADFYQKNKKCEYEMCLLQKKDKRK